MCVCASIQNTKDFLKTCTLRLGTWIWTLGNSDHAKGECLMPEFNQLISS